MEKDASDNLSKMDKKYRRLYDKVPGKKHKLKYFKQGKTNRKAYIALMKQMPEDEAKASVPMNSFSSLAPVLRAAARMYGLPVPLERSHLPLGYDSLVSIDGVQWCFPNDEAFKVLVRAKHLLKHGSFVRVAAWLDKELKTIGYDFRGVRGYNPSRGIAPMSLFRVIKYFTPRDVCVLPLHERREIFRAEIEAGFPAHPIA